jgi:AraC-like DNA-binding protein
MDVDEDAGPAARDLLVAEIARLGGELERGARADAGAAGHRRLAAASCFSTRRVTRFAQVVPRVALLAAVLEGHKQVVHRGRARLLGAGDVLVVAAGVGYESTTVPDRRSGRYRVLVLEAGLEVSAALARWHPELCRPGGPGAFDAGGPHVVAAGVPTLQALLHVGRTLLGAGAHDVVLRHRMQDLLLCLSIQHAAGPGPRPAQVRPPPLTDLVLGVRALIRDDPAAAWPAALVARRLAVSPATLRRRLAAAGLSLRRLRVEERMALAAVLLSAPGARVVDVAARCGYGSPSKFARQYRQWFGRPPARIRAVQAV